MARDRRARDSQKLHETSSNKRLNPINEDRALMA
jgi:hypothetical protein